VVDVNGVPSNQLEEATARATDAQGVVRHIEKCSVALQHDVDVALRDVCERALDKKSELEEAESRTMILALRSVRYTIIALEEMKFKKEQTSRDTTNRASDTARRDANVARDEKNKEMDRINHVDRVRYGYGTVQIRVLLMKSDTGCCKSTGWQGLHQQNVTLEMRVPTRHT
jgi:hypothetical protein